MTAAMRRGATNPNRANMNLISQEACPGHSNTFPDILTWFQDLEPFLLTAFSIFQAHGDTHAAVLHAFSALAVPSMTNGFMGPCLPRLPAAARAREQELTQRLQQPPQTALKNKPLQWLQRTQVGIPYFKLLLQRTSKVPQNPKAVAAKWSQDVSNILTSTHCSVKPQPLNPLYLTSWLQLVNQRLQPDVVQDDAISIHACGQMADC